MNLPNQIELLTTFSGFLIESGLSAVSVKNYLSDIRHFLSFCATTDVSRANEEKSLDIAQVFQSINKYIILYVENQKSIFTPQSTVNRRLASIRRFTTFLSIKYNFLSDSGITAKNSNFQGIDRNISTPTSPITSNKVSFSPNSSSLTTDKIIDQFKSSLEKEKKTHSTIKNYVSDLNHFFAWTANQTPYTIQNLVNILSEAQLHAYVTYLKLSRTSVSVINRRQSSIKKLAKFCATQEYIPENPFEIKAVSQPLAPLAWIERLSRKASKPSNAPKNRFAILYGKYNSLPFTPYLHIALLVLATSAMAIFGYTQIISQARPSAAATALTPPKRQLSFQGRLTDTGGTPITTAVNIIFKLFNASAGPTQLYSSGTCTITPDQDGIFNTLIGDGVCGSEINSSVFTDNRDVYLELTVGAETLTPRQQIATVGYALNSETLQGYPASASATINTVPVVDNSGNITIAATSPSLVSTSGNFTIKGNSLTLSTATNSGGNVVLAPDALGSGQILGLGGTTSTDSVRFTNANLTTGSLISGYVGSDLMTGRLLTLSSGSTETNRFWVNTDGSTNIDATATSSAFIVNQTGTGDLITASSSGATKFKVTANGNVDITGQYLINGSPISGSNWQRTAGSLAPLNITDSINIGATSTASAKVHLAGTTNENSFINTGNLGIGTINPSSILELKRDGANLKIGTDTQDTAARPSLSFMNNSLGGFTGDDHANQQFGFFSTLSDNRTYDSLIRIYGKATGSWGRYLGLTHDGDNGIITTDVGNLNLLPSSNVGIGTSTPTAKLDVAGTASVSAGLTGATYLTPAGNLATTNMQSLTIGGATTGNITIGTNNGTISLDSNIWDITSAGIASGLTGITSSGTITFSGLAANRFVGTTTGGQLTTSMTSSDLANSLSNETGTGVAVFSDAPTFTTSITSPLVLGGSTATSYLSLQSTSATGTTDYINFLVGNNGGTEAMRIIDNGYVGFGLPNPSYKIDVSGDINITGNYYQNGVPFSGSNWYRSNGSLAPKYLSDAINLGSTSTSSALVHFTGTAGDNSFVATGFFGVGTNNPGYTLDVYGNVNIAGGGLRVNNSYGAVGQLLTSTGTGLQWTDATTSGVWQRVDGSVAPLFLSDSVNIGSTSTASAFVHLAGTSGENSFVNTGNFGIGLINPGYKLDVNGDINLSGGIRASGSFGTPGQILSSTGTGVQWIPAGTGTGSDSWIIENTGVVHPKIDSLDVLIGSNATASAKFAFQNVATGTPTASISGSTANVATYVTGNGNLATTNMQPLTLGGSSTGPIQLSPKGTTGLNVDGLGRTGIGTAAPAYGLDVNGTARVVSTVTVDSLTASRLVVTDGSKNLTSTISSSDLALSISDETGSGVAVFGTQPTFTTDIRTPYVIGGTAANSSLSLKSTTATGTTDYINFLVGNNGGTEAMRVVSNGNIGMGTISPLAKLDVRTTSGTAPAASISGATATSALIIDQSGVGDIFSASTSGTTRLTLRNNGNIVATGAISGLTGLQSSGTIQFSSLGTGILHASASGIVSSSAVDLAADVTGTLPIANGGTGNTTFSANKFVAYDGSKLASTAYDASSFETPLTFNNGLTRSVNTVTWGGTLSTATNINMNGNDVTFTGSGNFGIGAASPSQKLDVAGFFVVDTVNSRVGIGTTLPSATLDIAGATSTISNASGDITLNAASGFINFSGDSLNNFLNATASGQIKLGSFSTAGQPTAIGTGSLIYNTTVNNPRYWNGSAWTDLTNFFQRDSAGIIAPITSYDSIHIGSVSSASAVIRLSSNNSFNTFFKYPVAIGFTSAINPTTNIALQTNGDILPQSNATDSLGRASYAFNNAFIATGINNSSGTQMISITSSRLTGGTPWNIVDGVRVGDTSNTLPAGVKLYVAGDATISGTLGVVGNSNLLGNVTVGGGTGKLDVGTVDPPYTINGEKFATYMSSMIGVKEEVMGKATVTELIPGLGYRALIDLDAQQKGSDLWLFSKTTDLKNNINNLSVLLTASGQGKTWYQIDTTNKILAIYSSTPADVTYRLTAPRFDSAKWTNTRVSNTIGFVINDSDNTENIAGTGLLNTNISAPALVAEANGSYTLLINGNETKEVASFADSIVANFKAGVATVNNLVADNLTIRTKLVSPIADIDSLKVIDATISGTLYADNIKGQTVDRLNEQLDLLNEKYSTASAILADLQAKYTNYSSLMGTPNTATVSGDPLALSPLATTSAVIPSDLALDTLNIHTIFTNDVLANGSIFTNSLSSFDTDLYIQPTGDKSVHLLANLMTLYPDGKVAISGDLLVTGTIYANNLDTRTATVSGTLALGKGDLATDSGKLIALFNESGHEVGSVDASGSASFGQLITDGLIIASSKSTSDASASASTNSNTTIGTATIATGSSEIVIANTKVTDNTLVYITPISDTNNQVLYVKSKQSGVGFTVAVPTPLSQEASFNYWLVQTK